MPDRKREVLEKTLTQIEKEFGKGAIMRLGDTSARLEVSTVPTGSLSLDIALGVGGFPRGRIIEIYGSEASGKSTLALHAVAEVQKRDGVAVYIDAENAFDPTYAEAIGVDPENLLISQPGSAEEALEMADMLVRSGGVDLVVVDSVAALVPRAELEGEMGESFVGMQARLMSQALRKLAGTIHRSQTIFIFINQLRQKIGVIFGNPETTPGGQALKYYSSIRIDMRRKEQLKRGDQVIGNRVVARVVKNKVAPPFRAAEFDILFGRGIWKGAEILDLGVRLGLIQKQGSWFSFGNRKLGQGRWSAVEALSQDPELQAELERRIREQALSDAPGSS